MKIFGSDSPQEQKIKKACGEEISYVNVSNSRFGNEICDLTPESRSEVLADEVLHGGMQRHRRTLPSTNEKVLKNELHQSFFVIPIVSAGHYTKAISSLYYPFYETLSSLVFFFFT